MPDPNWRQEFCDFPTGWWIQDRGLTHTDDRCSAAQSGGAFLCDCGAVTAEWERRRAAHYEQCVTVEADGSEEHAPCDGHDVAAEVDHG